ncbi:piggyBac transposable element-derived protein 4-like [Schistocerca cancellata]|uniref:piggyBac transposable element-derived protein 4-like n=1 Tax=Schistocerca cancellata TaxID=274614 RepID=UPI0021196B6A|nr:piggyBac transposable element-derived protein 4-like [Schistocerca cancellata]
MALKNIIFTNFLIDENDPLDGEPSGRPEDEAVDIIVTTNTTGHCSLPYSSGQWTDDDTITPRLPVFSESCGIQDGIDQHSSVFDCFMYFFDEELVRLIKRETNCYTRMTIETLSATGKLKPQSVWHKWTTVKLSELCKYFGIILHMCLVSKPKLTDYWSTNPVLQSSFAAKCLPRDRFLSILRMLHLVDNATYIPKNQVGHNPIHKVRPIFNRCVTQSGKAYKPGERNLPFSW